MAHLLHAHGGKRMASEHTLVNVLAQHIRTNESSCKSIPCAVRVDDL